jgi:hypothetical protein
MPVHSEEPPPTSGTNSIPLMAVNLQYDNAGTKVLADGVLAAFDDAFSKTIGTEDASEIPNTNESLAINNTSELLSIDARPMPAHPTILFF